MYSEQLGHQLCCLFPDTEKVDVQHVQEPHFEM